MRGPSRSGVAAVLAVVALAAGCRVAPSVPAPPAAIVSLAPVACLGHARVPPGFRRSQDIAFPGLGVVGHRRTFLDGQGRRLHITSGVSGSFGEALPVQATVAMSEGDPGHLRGIVGGDAWVIIGGGEHACEPQTITGLGFGREGFMKAAIATGLVKRAG